MRRIFPRQAAAFCLTIGEANALLKSTPAAAIPATHYRITRADVEQLKATCEKWLNEETHGADSGE